MSSLQAYFRRSQQDICNRPLVNIYARDLYSGSLCKISDQDLYVRSWQDLLQRDILPQGLQKIFLGKVAVGNLCTSSLKEISSRPPVKMSAKDLPKRTIFQAAYGKSLSKISYLARTVQEISMHCILSVQYISTRSLGQVAVRYFYARSLCQDAMRDLQARSLQMLQQGSVGEPHHASSLSQVS